MKKRDSDISTLLFKRSGKEKIIFVVAFILFALYTITMVAPFIWLFISSLKGGLEYRMDSALGQAFGWPDKLLFTNYIDAFRELEYDGKGLFDMLFNSVWYTLVVTVEGVFFSACTGYCLSKYEFKLKNLLYGIAIFSMTIPIVGTLGASFKLSADLGIYDTPLQPILSCAGGFGFNFLIMYSFFKSMPWSYAEAVFMDGGGHFTAFFKVMLPMASAPIGTLSIIAAINCWNDYSSIVLYLPHWPTIASGLYYIERQMTRGNMPVYFAALFLSMVPVLIIFSLFSEKIMKNMTVGGMKG